MSILLVCNEPSFRVVLGDLLREGGYEVDVCRGLDGAKRELQRTGYELVIVNLLGSGDTALQACHDLKSIRPEQKIAFIRGPWANIPPEACPDYLIPLEQSLKELLGSLAQVVEPLRRDRHRRELSASPVRH